VVGCGGGVCSGGIVGWGGGVGWWSVVVYKKTYKKNL
jgi:hypothetical protein